MKPSITDVLPLFLDYFRKHPTWGSLHIVLDDGNVSDSNIDFCENWAKERNDTDGVKLARILKTMSKTQRLKLPNVVYKHTELKL